MSLMDKLFDLVGVYNYDSSNTDVIVAGNPLTDFTTVSVDESPHNRSEQGVDKSYHTNVSIIPTCTLTISVLPDGKDSGFLRALDNYIRVNKGYFEISIKTNGRWVGTYSCYFLSVPREDITEDANDHVFLLGGVREDVSTFSGTIEQI